MSIICAPERGAFPMQFKWQASLSDGGALKSEINLAFLIAAIRVTLEPLTISAAVRTEHSGACESATPCRSAAASCPWEKEKKKIPKCQEINDAAKCVAIIKTTVCNKTVIIHHWSLAEQSAGDDWQPTYSLFLILIFAAVLLYSLEGPFMPWLDLFIFYVYIFLTLLLSGTGEIFIAKGAVIEEIIYTHSHKVYYTSCLCFSSASLFLLIFSQHWSKVHHKLKSSATWQLRRPEQTLMVL